MQEIASRMRRRGWRVMAEDARYCVFELPGCPRWVQLVLGSDGRLYVGTSRRMICKGGA